MSGYKLQLPSPPENFEGRNRELGKLAKYFFNQHIMIIAGLAGMGKTSMALSFARMLNTSEEFSDYNDNVFWIYCEPDWKADSVLQAINRWLLDRGVDSFDELARDPEIPLESRLQQLVTILESGRFVVFLDDFHQVEDDSTRLIIRFCKKYLQQGKLIITTRKRVKLSALDRVDILERRLDGLSREDATALIRHLLLQHEITTISDEHLQGIYNKTRGHPFSVKLFVSLLITGDSTLEELLEGSGEFEEEMARYLMEKNFASLPEAEKDFLERFSVFRVPVPPAAMEKIAPDLNTRALRKSLADRYLVDLNPQKLMFMHGIMRSYCLQNLSDSRKRELHQRCSEYFEGCEPSTANLLEAHYHCTETGSHDKALDIANRALDKLEETGQLQELHGLIRKTLEIHDKPLPRFRYFEAEISRAWGRYEEARNIFESLLDEKKDHISTKAKAGLARTLILEGDYSQAIDLLQEAVREFEDAGNKVKSAESLNRLGIVYMTLNNLEAARECLDRCLQLSQETADLDVQAAAYSNLGNICMRYGDYQKALDHYNMNLELKPDQNSAGYASTLYNIALLHFEQGHLDRARAILDETMEIRQKIQDRRGLSYALNLLGEIEYLQDNTGSALELFQQSQRLADSAEDRHALSDIRINTALIYIENSEYDQAIEEIDGAREILASVPDTIAELVCMALIAEIYSLQRRFELVEEMRSQISEAAAGDVDDPTSDEGNRGRTVSAEVQKDVQKALLAYLEAGNTSRDGNMSASEKHLNTAASHAAPMRASLRMRLDKHFARNDSEGMYEIHTSEGMKRATLREVERMKARKDDFDLWVDLTEKQVTERTKGPVNILRKRTLAPLFLFLLRNAGKEFSSRKLFTEVWKRPFDYETDGITIRVNISRLRNLVEPVSGQSQYIKISSNGGKYFFDRNASFCLICEPASEEDNCS